MLAAVFYLQRIETMITLHPMPALHLNNGSTAQRLNGSTAQRLNGWPVRHRI